MKITEFRDKIARNQDGEQKQNIAEISDTLEDINRNTDGDFYKWIEGIDTSKS
jgi:hypothetical protein